MYYQFVLFCLFFFFNDTATTEIYTLSLHDALPIFHAERPGDPRQRRPGDQHGRSEEHTSELQSHVNLVCRLLLEKKKKHTTPTKPYQKNTYQKPNRKITTES